MAIRFVLTPQTPRSLLASALAALFALSSCSHPRSAAGRASALPSASVAPEVASASASARTPAASASASPSGTSAATHPAGFVAHAARRARPGGVCHVHWAANVSKVAIVSGTLIRVQRLASGAWIKNFHAPAGARFVDYSLPRNLALERRGASYELVDPATGHRRFAAKLAGAVAVQLSEDGLRAVFKLRNSGSQWFVLNLATGARRAIHVPMFSAGGSNAVVVWVRRRSAQVKQSRIATAFFDYLAKPSAKGAVPLLRVTSCFATANQGKGAFYGADTDALFRTAVVARKPCERAPHLPVIEVYRRAAHSNAFKRTRSWRYSGKLRAMWLSPRGRRVIVRTRRHREALNAVYDTRTGKVRGDVELNGDCFEFTPHGDHIAQRFGRDVHVSRLP